MVTATPSAWGVSWPARACGGTSTLATSGGDDAIHPRDGQRHAFQLGHEHQHLQSLAAGTYAPGAVSDAVSLPVVTAENGGLGLPGEGSYDPVTVSLHGQRLAARVVTATPIGPGPLHGQPERGRREHAGHHGRRRRAYTRVTVNGTLFNSATSTSSYISWPRAPMPRRGERNGDPAGGDRRERSRSHRRGQLHRVTVGLQRQRPAGPRGHGLGDRTWGVSWPARASAARARWPPAAATSTYTRVTVNGTLFNSATATSTYNLGLGHLYPGHGERPR